jgi:ectoine hydroxylase-related dioxygenase (phytanoyl-CoA dioxygenase family)
VVPDQTAMVIRSALGRGEIAQLTRAVNRCMHSGPAISSFVYLEDTTNPVLAKIQAVAERALGRKLLYLNDFYLYTDGSFQANWHIDTEMFSFEQAVNVWIPLDDTVKANPIAFISGVNDRSDRYYHSISTSGSNYEFMNLVNFNEEARTIDEVEDTRIPSGDVAFGDILLLNPRRFHRTNSGSPKHAFIIKFVIPGEDGLQARQMVPPVVWPEVALFEEFMPLQHDWPIALARLRRHLSDPVSRRELTAGFFPERLELFRQKISELMADQSGAFHDN